jgi:O-antigen/teichoic acid export membrane protein
MTSGVAALLKKGFFDTALQIFATTGVRFALVLAIFVLSRFVSNDDIATYDLFVVASSILLILLTCGLDSGLAIVAQTDDDVHRAAYLWLALGMCFALSLTLFLPLRFGASSLGLGSIFDARIFTAAYLYAVGNAMMILLFSYYRWLGNARTASLIIIMANIIGFLCAAFAFSAERSIVGFVHGLLIGNLVGVAAAIAFIFRRVEYPKHRVSSADWQRFALTLISMSWPFGIASLLLIARRAVDRAIIMSTGLAALLGAYALVSRSGEVSAFLFALPALGFAPIIIRGHATDAGQTVARGLYLGYFGLSVLIMLISLSLWLAFGNSLFPANARDAAPIFLALLAGNLMFTETTVAGFGFVIVQRTWLVAALSVLFIMVNVLVAAPLSMAGYGLKAVAAGYLLASYVHSTLFIYLSERHIHFGYPLRAIVMVKTAIIAIILALLFYASAP